MFSKYYLLVIVCLIRVERNSEGCYGNSFCLVKYLWKIHFWTLTIGSFPQTQPQLTSLVFNQLGTNSC